ncbi:hypothetical protein CLV58_102222 [Spirosoma oryzae]|uniref:CopG-like ribbon-helix-helix domain-containing protein n=1 Tax=Spirosoma oryzae TaxID=1469603 RepID=A0A2T0TII1_9BACT|nr:hypothetical protein [Spirosoma oryzae]PRY45473.1 hypothetical protein CLV58_102222 [Spirosoma oryzae]
MPAEKKAFVLRIQAETLKELERWAQDEFRSVNGQIEFLLSDALRRRKRRARNADASSDSEDASEATDAH